MAYHVVFSGLSGVGKSTAIKESLATLPEDYSTAIFHQRKTGEDAMRVHEKLQEEYHMLTPEQRLALVLKGVGLVDRQYIEPALSKHDVVVVDRGKPCAIAMHGAGEGLGEDYVADRIAAAGVMKVVPNRVILLDAPTDVTYERLHARAEDGHIFSGEAKEFQERVRFSYLRQAIDNPELFRMVDATNSREEVASEVARIMRQDLEALVMGERA